MGMLFSGWAREEEDIVSSDFNGDWNKYNQSHIQQRLELEEEVEETLNGIRRGDIICTWNKLENKAENEFYIFKIKNGKIIGHYVKMGNGEQIEYPFENYLKICSILEKD